MAIRGEKRPVKKDVKINANLHNRFDVEVKDARTGEVRQRAVGYNVILNQFWTRLFAGNSVYDYIQYGSGSGTPDPTDTALFHREGGAAAGAYSYDDAHYAEGWNSFTRSITLDEQTAVGVVFSEVGVAGATNSALCTHAMLQDMNGNPITITKTSTDILTIYATVYIHWNVNGINGVKYVPQSHWFGTAPGGSISLVKGFNQASHISTKSYASGDVVGDATNKTWSFAVKRFAVGDANCYGCIGAVFSRGTNLETFYIELQDDHQITGESVGTGDGTTTTFDLLFDLPYDVSIYIDGVLQSSGYTVYDECHYADVSYFEKLDYQSTPLIHIPTLLNTHNYIFYNPHYQSIAITKVHSVYETSYGTWPKSIISTSDDMENWIEIARGQWNVSIPVQYRHYKYWKEEVLQGNGYAEYFIEDYSHAIVFDTPPAAGAVITASYKTPFLPKDENHVYDIGFTVTLGEYTGV